MKLTSTIEHVRVSGPFYIHYFLTYYPVSNTLNIIYIHISYLLLFLNHNIEHFTVQYKFKKSKTIFFFKIIS